MSVVIPLTQVEEKSAEAIKYKKDYDDLQKIVRNMQTKLEKDKVGGTLLFVCALPLCLIYTTEYLKLFSNSLVIKRSHKDMNLKLQSFGAACQRPNARWN